MITEKEEKLKHPDSFINKFETKLKKMLDDCFKKKENKFKKSDTMKDNYKKTMKL